MSSCLSLTSICLGILCGVVIYKVFSRNADNDVSVVETSDYSVIVLVAKRLEELYGGIAYVGLRIPDPDTGSRQNIDIVLVTNGEAVVISVKNFSGFVSINEDNSWSCMGEDQDGAVLHPDPVAEVKKQASILESYLEQRGIALQESSLSYKVILPNLKLCHINTNLPEVITCDQLMQLKPEHYKLSYIIGTAPAWDRLELQGNRFIWGEFLEFKGEREDTLVLRYVKRSKVSRLIIQNQTPPTLIVLYSIRDFRNERAAAPEWKIVGIKSNVEVLFRLENSTEVHKFQLSSIFSLSLSA